MANYELIDLGDLVRKTRERLDSEFNPDDVGLSSCFKAAISRWVDSCGNSIKYMKYSVEITTAGNLKIYAPNQWFILASYAVDLLKEIIRYQEYTERIIDDNLNEFQLVNGELKEKKDVYKTLRANDSTTLEDVFKKASEEIMLKEGVDEEIAKRNATLLYRFVSDEKWWLGGKGIERTNDFYVSPVLGVLNLVNASQSYVASIAYAYVCENDLSEALPSIIASDDDAQEDTSLTPPAALCYETSLQNPMPRNHIIFGAPGTGKSYTINKERVELLGEDSETDYERVTFHPDYSYANFVGTYKPVPCKDSDGKDSITYEYVPGPFMRIYVKALKNGRTENPRPFLLIIEEINRANGAAVFGDVFQLLDRDENGVSEYPINASKDMKQYMADELGGDPEMYSKIKIPNNMFIWATMNSADQGVFPMDTAFKRRWDFTYLGINDSEEELIGKTVEVGSKEKGKQRIEWNKLRRAINNFLAKQKINEDKQLGPYFLSKSIVVPEEGNVIDSEKFSDAFKSKVIMYLFEDAGKQKRSELFKGCFSNSSRYSEICREFDEKGIGIFHEDIQHETEPYDLFRSGHAVGTEGTENQ